VTPTPGPTSVLPVVCQSLPMVPEWCDVANIFDAGQFQQFNPAAFAHFIFVLGLPACENTGSPCQMDSDCPGSFCGSPRICASGAQASRLCLSNSECPGSYCLLATGSGIEDCDDPVCDGGSNALAFCTTASQCPGGFCPGPHLSDALCRCKCLHDNSFANPLSQFACYHIGELNLVCPVHGEPCPGACPDNLCGPCAPVATVTPSTTRTGPTPTPTVTPTTTNAPTPTATATGACMLFAPGIQACHLYDGDSTSCAEAYLYSGAAPGTQSCWNRNTTGARCVGGTNIGALCTAGSQCPGSTCTAGFCQGGSNDGAPCVLFGSACPGGSCKDDCVAGSGQTLAATCCNGCGPSNESVGLCTNVCANQPTPTVTPTP
jgi:hypothetical protein